MATLEASTCLYCGEPAVSGPIICAGVTTFHPECFRCSRCQACIGDDEQYALVGLTTLFCKSCWAENNFLDLEDQHVIKVVKIPPLLDLIGDTSQSQYKLRNTWLNSNNEYDDFSTPQIFEIGHCGSECPLSVGDRILEVNGTPVHDHSLPDIEKLLNQRTSVVQVTVEQTPLTEMQTRRLEDSKFGSLNSLELGSTDLWGSYDEMNESENRLSRRSDERRSRSRPPRRSNGCEERAASLSRLSDCSPTPPGYSKAGLARTLSFREQARSQCTFRACDLVKGELLGMGFFGQVYKVTHSETKEVMVLKELYRLDEEAQKNFLKEVAVLRRLEHPNVLRFVGVLYKERKLHLITEYVHGGSLREQIQNFQEPLSWTRRTQFLHDISRGMAYLHSMGVIHRDLSSHNCLVREDNSVVVADFGLARITSEMTLLQDRYRATTKSGRRIERKKRYTVVGNPFWMAPEMMRGFKYDEKVDVFSFGIIMCELIGRVHADPDFLPRSGDFSLNQNIFLEKFCADCPEPLYRIAFMCCDLNPDNRPSFETLSGWFESISSSLIRGLSFPKDLQSEINSFIGNIILSPTSSECSTPENPYAYSSNISFGSPACMPSTNSSAYADCTLSSSISTVPASSFVKTNRLQSIQEVTLDHSCNNNSVYSTSTPGPIDIEHSFQNGALSASPS